MSLYEQGYRAEVTNYGQLNYVSTQEVIALLRLIQRGNVPDIVLFYDGINDVVSSHYNGEAGITKNEQARREEFHLSWRPQQLAWFWGKRVLPRYFWGFRRLVTGLQRRVRPQAAPLPMPIDDEVTRQTVRVYQANIAIVESLGRSYGFDPLFYWQPTIFSKRHRSPHEQLWAERFSFMEPTYDATYRRIRGSEILNSHPRFYNISALLDDLEEPYYWDHGHVSETGNQRIAVAMVDDVIALIEQRRVAATGKAVR